MPKAKEKLVENKFSLFGWHGITFHHPKDWGVSKLTGGEKKGEVLIDDGFLGRIEVHWEDPTLAFSLEKIISKHIELVKRETKRKRLPFKIERKVTLTSSKIFKERNGEIFIWESDYRVFSLIWYCKICGKVLFLRIFSKLRESMQGLARKIFESLQDHTSDDKLTWGLFGFLFRTPKEYRLKSYSLKSGYLSFSFTRDKDKLVVERWALGDLQLENKNLKDWFCEKYRKECKFIDYGSSLKEDEVHTQLRFFYDKRGKIPIVRWRKIIEGKVWYCKRSNRIFVLISHLFRNGPSMIEEVEKAVVCH